MGSCYGDHKNYRDMAVIIYGGAPGSGANYKGVAPGQSLNDDGKTVTEKPDDKPEDKPEDKPDDKPEDKPDNKPEEKPDDKPDENKPIAQKQSDYEDKFRKYKEEKEKFQAEEKRLESEYKVAEEALQRVANVLA